jgi:RsiW-degrading membrane proteinase PrsW (M82 family)
VDFSISPIIFIIAAPLIPSLVWLFFFLREDMNPEPRRLVIYTFTAGALVSILILALQVLIQHIAFAVQGTTDTTLFTITLLALIEEVLKFGAAYWAVSREPAFDEPIDAMIYTIAAALGFATVENFFVAVNSVGSFAAAALPDAAETLALRFAGATFLHALAAGIMGYAWAKTFTSARVWTIIAVGIAGATAVHAAFNYLIFRFQHENLIYPTALLIAALCIVLADFERLKTTPQTEQQKTEV